MRGNKQEGKKTKGKELFLFYKITTKNYVYR